jgi:hypothetical protein
VAFHSTLSRGADKIELPRSVAEAMSGPYADHWRDAMNLEYAALISNNTWCLVPRPKDSKPISTKWVFQIKYNPDGTILKFKARLVARGFVQVEGQDYNLTFAPVAKMNTIRLLFALAVDLGLTLKQFDIMTAFLNGDIDLELYITQPEGFISDLHPDYVCLLLKSLYGLKQSPRLWNFKFNSVVLDAGYVRSDMDPCLYIKRGEGNTVTYLLLYVDDGVIASNDDNEVNRLMDILKSSFQVKEMDRLTYLLGLQVDFDVNSRNILRLHQESYIQEICADFRLLECKPMSTPCETRVHLPTYTTPQSGISMDLYRKGIGKLLYASNCTRPDISFVVGLLSRHLQFPGKEHFTLMLRVMKYLKNTANYGLVYYSRVGQPNVPVGYSDSSFADNRTDSKSTGGYTFNLSGAAITWRSKKQSLVSTSSTEAEYIALCDAVGESIWLRQIMNEMTGRITYPILVYCDNSPTISIASDVGVTTRNKHILVKYHYSREMIQKKYVVVEHISTSKNLADIMTKGLGSNKLQYFRSGLGVKSILDTVDTIECTSLDQGEGVKKSVKFSHPMTNGYYESHESDVCGQL